MIRKYVLPVIALGLFLVTVIHVVRASKEEPKTRPPVEPATSPFSQSVAGAGIIEAATENIAVGSNLPGVVVAVNVKVGQKVKIGAPLFRLDERQLKAEHQMRQAQLAIAQAQLQKLQEMPRQPERALKEAKLREAEFRLSEAEDQWQRSRAARQAVSREELFRFERNFRMSQEEVAAARAEVDLLPAWDKDVLVAKAQVQQAQAQVAQVETDLARLTTKALIDGEVLQVNVRPGEFVGTPASQTLVLLGNVRPLHVRVDIDEHDIPRFVPGAAARAQLRGHPDVKFDLDFVRVEPYVVPKKSLTGDNTERVDTRVLQVIYAARPAQKTLYVGQQVDVFIDAGQEATSTSTQR